MSDTTADCAGIPDHLLLIAQIAVALDFAELHSDELGRTTGFGKRLIELTGDVTRHLSEAYSQQEIDNARWQAHKLLLDSVQHRLGKYWKTTA